MGLQRSLVRPQVARSLGSNDRHIGRGLRSPPPHASEATYPERVKVGEELFFGPADDLPCSRRRGVLTKGARQRRLHDVAVLRRRGLVLAAIADALKLWDRTVACYLIEAGLNRSSLWASRKTE